LPPPRVLTSTERLRGGFRSLLSADTSAAAICPVSGLSRAMLTECVGENSRRRSDRRRADGRFRS
jgi:hypothetical protein